MKTLQHMDSACFVKVNLIFIHVIFVIFLLCGLFNESDSSSDCALLNSSVTGEFGWKHSCSNSHTILAFALGD